ncbi:possible transposase (plasmid) [Rhodococcus jostii RHA1]|uniref:Possible transposase n=1 Tax=Rhodococcus jostii (strain RHA1) TaxID=101510 RepID=Q0S059_RHOJR|nr:possible transposase [Rhodococcus jostii RHA1]
MTTPTKTPTTSPGTHCGEVDENGRRLIVRNGYHQAREVLTSAGAVRGSRARGSNDRRLEPDTDELKRFSSAILPAGLGT